MTSPERWLAATWELVQRHLPAAPARVVDVGCGRLGGFVPMLLALGYDAVGVDPEAPDEEQYQRVEFERAVVPGPIDTVIASTSLHHVTDPSEVIDRMVGCLRPGGFVVVVEWASEKFDGATARWCFDRLGAQEEPGWLHELRDEWLASGLDWPQYVRGWLKRDHLHSGDVLVRLLDERLEPRLLAYGPYFFPDLEDTTEAEEQAAISAGRIQPSRIEYVGVRR
jgi:SAM-dependent methyltransferase